LELGAPEFSNLEPDVKVEAAINIPDPIVFTGLLSLWDDAVTLDHFGSKTLGVHVFLEYGRVVYDVTTHVVQFYAKGQAAKFSLHLSYILFISLC
jgi:hypothetical protein